MISNRFPANHRVLGPFRVACLFTVFAGALLTGCSSKEPSGSEPHSTAQQTSKLRGSYQRDAHGLTVSLAQGTVKKVRLQVMAANIVRVTATPQTGFDNLLDYRMVIAEPAAVSFETVESGNIVSLKTSALSAEVNLVSGEVRFLDAAGKVLLREAGRGDFGPVIDEPGEPRADAFAVSQNFLVDADEGFYGLGQQQDGVVNYAGRDVELTTHNLVVTIPFMVSSDHYGVLWNNAAVSRFGDPRPAQPLGAGFELFDEKGARGALTVRYYDGDTLLLTRRETDTDYQFLSHGDTREIELPEQVVDAADLRVEIAGTLAAKNSGNYTLKMYSSGYARLRLDGETLLERWRMNWNPWYHTVELAMREGESKTLAVDWRPNGGYFRLLQNAPRSGQQESMVSFTSDTARAIDYYFVAGADSDEVIAGYRTLTGKAVMLPKWAYGFWQSRERYEDQAQLLDVVKRYRELEIPIDNIVLDWSYWPEAAWGSHDFDKSAFPDPKGMTEAVHQMNAQIMVSVWPKFYPGTDHFKAMEAGGHLFTKNIEAGNRDWIGPGYANAFYDAFDPQARTLFWQQIDTKLNANGFDAWWLDATEPDMHSNLSFTRRKDLMTPNAAGSGAEFFNAYALPHAESVYQNDRGSSPEQRIFILTRSGFGGIQRTASAIWSGDIVSRWSNLKEQIAAGINVGLAGMPNWTFDIGGFTPEDRYRYNSRGETVTSYKNMDPAQVPEWQELNARWFQFAAFAPLMRAHGQSPYREIYNIAEVGSLEYWAMAWFIQLRYQLLPYIYTEAGNQYHRDGTLMRGLVMDFADDPEVRGISDQYMFGPALLVNPVYEYEARRRKVYLPAGTEWYNFYSGERLHGGQTVMAKAPYTQIPVFVRAGSILPTGPDLQYVNEKPEAPVTLNVYTGADGAYELYEDDGESYAYERGAWSRIPMRYNNTDGTLTIGARQGEFAGMPDERAFHIRWLSGPRVDAANFTERPDVKVQYRGEAITITR